MLICSTAQSVLRITEFRFTHTHTLSPSIIFSGKFTDKQAFPSEFTLKRETGGKQKRKKLKLVVLPAFKITIMEPSSCEFGDAAGDCYEIMYLGKKEHSAQNPSLARQALPTSATTPIPSTLQDITEHIKVGSFYEIDHSKLPRQTPEQLKSIRVVMVSEKVTLNLSLRFPSIYSLRTHFNDSKYGNPEAKKVPALDEKYIMASEVAAEVLFRRVPAQEIAESKNLWDFWVAPSMASKRNSRPPESSGGLINVASNKASCLSALKLTGMVQWGNRRQVRFLDPREESKHNPLSSSEKEENEYFCEDEEDEDEDEDEEEEEEEEEEKDMKKGGLKVRKAEAATPEVKNYCRSKRKLRNKNSKTPKPKPAKRQKRNQIIVYNRSKKKAVKNSVDRWSAARYKLAEENMLKIMKAKGAVVGKPILRPALRSEARKLIGDTGLLDHLLKHMAGKVAPGGTERFRRRHNSDGAMEYWLESADLVNIRREAGVQDPYWTPPPGWQPGDNPAQDPICSRELKELREEMAKMKKDMQELASRKQEEDLIIVTTPNSMVTSMQWDHEGSLLTPKELYMDLVNWKGKIEEQMKEISQCLSGMKEQMRMLKPRMGEHMLPELEAPEPVLMGSPTTPSDTEREIKGLRQKNKSAMKPGEIQGRDKSAAIVATEDKAAKIQRLKSGFRICKPQGTFLWPNMNMPISPQLMVQLEDSFVVQTPPSVSSSTTTPAAHHLLHISQPQYGPHPTSPVKPLAEKCPVSTTTLCTVSKQSASPSLPPPSETITKTSFINLNEFPTDQNNDTTTLSGTLTYQRRQQHSMINDASMTNLEKAKKEEGRAETEENVLSYSKKQHPKDCSPDSISSSALPQTGEAWWMAMATRNK